MIKLDVPYVSQSSATAGYSYNDCGIAAIAMLVHAFGSFPTVDDIYVASGIYSRKGLYVSTIQKAAAVYGVNLVYANKSMGVDISVAQELLRTGHPFVVLVDYDPVERANLNKYSINGGHFVTVVGYDERGFFVHDPYWDGNAGAYLHWPYEVFEAAWYDPGTYYTRDILYTELPVKIKESSMSDDKKTLGGEIDNLREALAEFTASVNDVIGFTEKLSSILESLDSDEIEEPRIYRVVSTNGLRIRKEPNTTSKVLGVLPYNRTVIKIGETQDGSWYKIKHLGTEGWMYASYLAVV